MQSTPWIARRQHPQADMRLYCFCHAGGNAVTFMSWQEKFDSSIELCGVQLPGRGTRLHEEACTSFSLLLPKLAEVIRHQGEMPFAFFGHSLGGLLAFELARYCEWNGLRTPIGLFVSGCPAPQERGLARKGRSRAAEVSELSNGDLIKALGEYEGTPSEVLNNRMLMAFALPAIRADFALLASYDYCHGAPLSIPITVLAGSADTHMNMKQALRWQEQTTNSCSVRWFEGGHFFIHTQRAAVIECLNTGVTSLKSSFYGRNVLSEVGI